MITALLQQPPQPGEISVWGVVVPAAIFVIAFLMTLLLYRHFAKQQAAAVADEQGEDTSEP